MTAIVDSEAWRELFATYQMLPELWNMNCEGYKNREKKRQSWLVLLEKYKAIDPNASVEILKPKLNNIRYCYRRELRKIMRSEKNGATSDEVYVPQLWYFNLLSFIKEQELSIITAESEDDENTSFSSYPPPSKKKCPTFKQQGSFQELDLSSALVLGQPSPMMPSSLGSDQDDATVYAEGWAYQYRKLTVDQQLKAKKAIDEILLLGVLGKLTFNSVDFAAALSPFQQSPRPASAAQPQQVACPSSSAYTSHHHSGNYNITHPKIEIYDNGEIL